MVIWRVLVVVETQIIHYNLYETPSVDPRAAYENRSLKIKQEKRIL